MLPSLAWTASVRRRSPGEWQGSALVGGQPSKGKGCAGGEQAVWVVNVRP